MPATALMMLLVAGHAAATWRSDQPHSRRRIRLANACVMMLTLPLLMAGFSLIDHRAEPRLWTLVWLAAMALLAVNIGLAMLDVANTLRLVRRARQRVRAALEGLSAEADVIRRGGKRPPDTEMRDGER